MTNHRLALAVMSMAGDEFLVVRQSPPLPVPGEEFEKYVDSDLWDLPSVPLKPAQGSLSCYELVDCGGGEAEKFDLSKFNFADAIDQVLMQVGLLHKVTGKWKILKYIKEAEFGPSPPTNTFITVITLKKREETRQESCMWMSIHSASELLSGVKPGSHRIGPIVYIGLFPSSSMFSSLTGVNMVPHQEYPPGITLVPMRSKTWAPYRTTNMVVVLPHKPGSVSNDPNLLVQGDALIVDPGCCSEVQMELEDIVAALPKKLVVFITHHHIDHVDGLSVVQRCNLDAVLLAHESTMRYMDEGMWSGAHIPITDQDTFSIRGQKLEVIFAPGHTGDHFGLLHVDTNSLIVGDHCVGEGSAVLDGDGGGTMKDYYDSTYKFLDLSPHVIIPMHGRINLWPMHMLSGYLKNRNDHEFLILKSIENGARSMHDILCQCYDKVDKRHWLLISYNTKLHIDHLDYQKKLPEGFTAKRFALTMNEFRGRVATGRL